MRMQKQRTQTTDFHFTIFKKPDIKNRCLEKKTMANYMDKGLKKIGITISKPMLAITCIIFGLMVILFPNLLVWIVGLFLVIQGALLLTDIFEHEWSGTTAAVPRGVYCSHCGTRNIEEAVFCKKCGEKLKQGRQKKSRN